MHHPKGGMCANCKNKHNNCSDLNFNEMPVIEKYKGGLVVKCVEFERSAKEKQNGL